jgi:hypothetical protein
LKKIIIIAGPNGATSIIVGMDGKEVRLTAQDLIKLREQEKTFAAT